MISALKRFGLFWYDFVVGDDWVVAVGAIVAIAISALATKATGASLAHPADRCRGADVALVAASPSQRTGFRPARQRMTRAGPMRSRCRLVLVVVVCAATGCASSSGGAAHVVDTHQVPRVLPIAAEVALARRMASRLQDSEPIRGSIVLTTRLKALAAIDDSDGPYDKDDRAVYLIELLGSFSDNEIGAPQFVAPTSTVPAAKRQRATVADSIDDATTGQEIDFALTGGPPHDLGSLGTVHHL